MVCAPHQVQTPRTRHFSGHCFYQFQGKKCPLIFKLSSTSTKPKNKTCTSSRDPTNAVLATIQGTYSKYKFSNLMMEKAS